MIDRPPPYFRSRAEMISAMSHPSYARDPMFRAAVADAIRASQEAGLFGHFVTEVQPQGLPGDAGGALPPPIDGSMASV